jgi:hypothetical protein
MRLKLILALGCLILFLAPPVARAEDHRCAADALNRAKALLRFHNEGTSPDAEIHDGTEAMEVAPVRAPHGDGKFAVLEVTSHIYKATYRMRFIYMPLDGCPLAGQEILEITGAKG